jgi:mRNA interferase MazF
MPVYQWAVAIADLDPVRGSEQRGRRPVLVVSNEDFNQAMPNLTVLPLERVGRVLGYVEGEELRQAVREAIADHFDLD